MMGKYFKHNLEIISIVSQIGVAVIRLSLNINILFTYQVLPLVTEQISFPPERKIPSHPDPRSTQTSVVPEQYLHYFC